MPPIAEALDRFDVDELQVGVDHSFSWLGVDCGLTDAASRRAAVDYLGGMYPGWTRQLVDRDVAVSRVELRCAAEDVQAAVYCMAELDAAAALGLVGDLSELSADSDVLLDALMAQLLQVGQVAGVSLATSGAATVHVRVDNQAGRAMAHVLSVIDSVAAGLQATEAQRALVRSSHPGLSATGPVTVSVTVKNQMVAMGLNIAYNGVGWDDAGRLMAALHGRSAGDKLSLIAAACAAERPSLIGVELGPSEPPGVHAWAPLDVVRSANKPE